MRLHQEYRLESHLKRGLCEIRLRSYQDLRQILSFPEPSLMAKFIYTLLDLINREVILKKLYSPNFVSKDSGQHHTDSVKKM